MIGQMLLPAVRGGAMLCPMGDIVDSVDTIDAIDAIDVCP